MAIKNYRLLQVTDQHFCNSHFWTRMLDPEFTPQKAQSVARRHFQELLDALSLRPDTRPPFDAVILSGDFTDRHFAQGFEIAELWIRMLIERQFAPSRNILLIPGNHDVNLGRTMPNTKTCLPIPRTVAEDSYRKFLRRLGEPFDSTAADLSTVTRISRTDSVPGLILVGLNSCRTERMDAQGWGYIGMDQLDSMMRRIYNDEAGFFPRDNDILIAFTHQNPLPIWDVGLPELGKSADSRKVSLLIDAPSLLAALNAFGFAALLHGHTHRSKTARLEGYDPRPDLFTRSLIVSGQGSFSANLDDCDRHHFAVLEIQLDVRYLALSHFYAARQTAGTDRKWVVFPEQGSEAWPLYDPGWRRKSVVEARRIFVDRVVDSADKWGMMESWALLYNRPEDEKERAESAAWRAVLENLARELEKTMGRVVSVEAVADAVEQIFAKGQRPNDTSGLWLPQYLAWLLRKRK